MKSLFRNRQTVNNQRGFTLIELIIASAISIIVLGLVAQVFLRQRESFVNQTNTAKMVANGRGAVEFVSRAIQNAGYQVIRGGKMLSASDHYVTTASDLDNNGVVEGDEILTYVLSSVGGANNRSITFEAFFDMDLDGQLLSSESSNFTIDYSLAGPPFNLMQYTLNPDGSTTGAVVAENIDNLVFRHFDPSGLELGVSAIDGTDPGTTNDLKNLPLVVPAADLPDVRTVNLEFLVRSKDPDENNNYQDTGTYPTGSAASQTSATPTQLSLAYADGFRRRTMMADASPRNLGLAPFGRLTVQPATNPVTCPQAGTSFVVTAVDSAGGAIDNWDVNLRTTDANVTVSSASVTTDSGGEATGSVSYNWSAPNFTTTLSADAQWTDQGGVLRSVITSVPISFVSPSGAGVFDDFEDGDDDGWAPINIGQWLVEDNEYNLIDGPTGEARASNEQVTGDSAAVDSSEDLVYTVPADRGDRLKLVVGVGSESAGSAGNPGVLNPQEFPNPGGSAISFTTGTYTVPSPSSSGNPLKLIVVASTEDNDGGLFDANSASFGGTNMTKIVGTQTSTGGGWKATVAMFYLDVTQGQSGAIAVGWPSEQSHMVINVVTLENVQPGAPSGPSSIFNNTSGNVTNGIIVTTVDNTLVVVGGTSGQSTSLSPVGSGHSISSSNNASDGNTMRGALGTMTVSSAGTVTGIGMTGSANRMSLVIAGFAPASAANPVPQTVTFGGAPMTLVDSASQTSGTGATGAAMYSLDVNPGQTGTITATWTGNVSERMISAITLDNVANGAAEATINAAGENNAATLGTLTGLTAGAMVISVGHQNASGNLTASGAGHNLKTDQQTDSANSSLTYGGLGAVPIPDPAVDLNNFGFSGNHTRRAMVMASFPPALVSVNDQVVTNGCSPWGDVDMLVKIKNEGGVSGPRYGGVIVRYVDASNYYYARFEHRGTADPSQYRLNIVKRLATNETNLKATWENIDFDVSAPGLPEDYYLRVRVEPGDIFKARWWKPADPANPTADEPVGTWLINETDAGTTITTGLVGLITNREDIVFDNVAAGPA